MARTFGVGRKLPKSSSTQNKFLKEDPTQPDGVGWVAVPAPTATATTFDPAGLDNTDATNVQDALEDFDAAITDAAGGGGSVVAYAQLTKSIPETTPTIFDTTDLFAANGTGITFNTDTDRFENVPNNTLVEVEFTAQNAGDGGTWLFRGTAQGNGGDIGNPGVVVAASNTVDFSIPAFAVATQGNVSLEAHFALLDTLTDATVTAFVKFTVPPA